MLMKRTALAAALCLAMSFAQAGFVDGRSTAAEIEVTFKSVAVSDLAAELVPPGFEASYASPDLMKKTVSINGKGTWDALLVRALEPAGLHMEQTDANGKKFVRIYAAPSTVSKPHIDVEPSTAAKQPVHVSAHNGKLSADQARLVEPVAKPLFTTSARDTLVSAVVQRWADQADMQLVWEPRDVDYPVQAENVWGTDFASSLRGLLGSIQAVPSRVRACIYANRPKRVVRIIKFNESCRGAF